MATCKSKFSSSLTRFFDSPCVLQFETRLPLNYLYQSTILFTGIQRFFWGLSGLSRRGQTICNKKKNLYSTSVYRLTWPIWSVNRRGDSTVSRLWAGKSTKKKTLSGKTLVGSGIFHNRPGAGGARTAPARLFQPIRSRGGQPVLRRRASVDPAPVIAAASSGVLAAPGIRLRCQHIACEFSTLHHWELSF